MGKKSEWHEQHEREREERRLARETEREEARQQWRARHDAELAERAAEKRAIREHRAEPGMDPFVIDMSRRMGLTPQQFIELQEQRRAEMDDINRKGDVAQQMAHLTPIDQQVH